MSTKEVVKLIEEERTCFNNIRDLKSITRGEHHLLKLFTLSLDRIQVGIEREV